MAIETKIEWADDTLNLWWGCVHRGVGCVNCYAEKLAERYHKGVRLWGADSSRLYCRHWKRELGRTIRIAREAGQRRLVFVNSMSDFFEESRPLVEKWSIKGDPVASYAPVRFEGRNITTEDVRRMFFQEIDGIQDAIFMLLTKRPENIRGMWPQAGLANAGIPGTLGRHVRLDNVWLGTSVACQQDANRNIPELLKCRDLCGKLFLSIEPLVSDVDLSEWLYTTRVEHDGDGNTQEVPCVPDIGLVIVGGESGPDARPCSVEGVRSILFQCEEAGVPVILKQLGDYCVTRGVVLPGQSWPVDTRMEDINFETGLGFRVRLKSKKGGDPAEWPCDLRESRERFSLESLI